jgi:hypothetical protein
MVRDAAAFAELAAALDAFGYVYGEMIFNFPSPAPVQRPAGVSLFGEPAIIVLSTRPPLAGLYLKARKDTDK